MFVDHLQGGGGEGSDTVKVQVGNVNPVSVSDLMMGGGYINMHATIQLILSL